MKVGESLKLIRVYHRVKQVDLAEALKLSSSHISEIEAGKKTPTVDVLSRYAEYFKIPVSSLIYVAESLESGAQTKKARITKKALMVLDWLEASTR